MARKPTTTEPDLNPAGGVFIFHGKDAFLRADLTARLKTALQAAHGEVESIHFDGTRDQLADVLDECRSFGLMQQHKLVVVEAADQIIKGDTRPLLERYAASPTEGATLALRCDTWRKGKADKLIADAGGAVIKCEGLPPAAALAWAAKRAKQTYGVTLSRDAGQLLVDRVGELGRIDSELAKLAVEAPKGTISREQVAELVGMTREEEVWSIQWMLLSAGPEELLTQLRTILGNTRQDQSIITLYACMDLCRKLHAASRALRQRQSPATIASRLKLWGPSRDAILGAARNIDPDRAGELLSLAVDADRMSKSGLGKPERLLERLTLEIAGATH
ncbi:MAG TPA: DNA polymerase III subunit delta [Phycisphaerales bacterium]|nr:DNA polymerase III subunit delta [Phycisphaerales bacterium]